MSIFEKYFSGYSKTPYGFIAFHNEVINMPRDQFSDTGLEKIKVLANYLLLTKDKLSMEGVSYKDIMLCIKENLTNVDFKCRDFDYENRYFTFANIDIQYDKEGRMFRHLMGLCTFFGLISSLSRQHKLINYDKCLEYALSDNETLMPIARNNMLSLNVKDNDFLLSLKGADITKDTDYRPTFAILKYLKQIDRPATKFELSILLGRVGELKTEDEIVQRALDVGQLLPRTQEEQKYFFFSEMGWINENGQFYQYAASQEPYFKFNSYLLFLQSFDLISIDTTENLCMLTEYSKQLLEDDISYLIADLQELVNRIGSTEDENNAYLNDLILYQRNPALMQLAKSDKNFFKKMNYRSLNHPAFDKKGKKIRNRLIMELAKIEVDYMCQYSLRHIFKMPNGKYYCEAHHIIEFNTENGPDITNNLVVLGPEAHSLIHHACKEEVDNAYLQLIKNGALKIERFKDMISIYRCLTEKHIDVLRNKKIITYQESVELKNMLAAH